MQKIKMTSEKIINYHFLQDVSCKFCNFKKALKSLQNSFNESLPFLRKQRQQKNPATLQDQKRLSEFYFLFSYSNSRHVNTLLGCQALTLSRQNVWVVLLVPVLLLQKMFQNSFLCIGKSFPFHSSFMLTLVTCYRI